MNNLVRDRKYILNVVIYFDEACRRILTFYVSLLSPFLVLFLVLFFLQISNNYYILL